MDLRADSESQSNEQRKAIALEYIKRLDRGEDFMDRFAGADTARYPWLNN